MSGSQGGGAGLKSIAGLKIVEALLLVAAGCAALGLFDESWRHELAGWLDELSLREGRRLTSQFASTALAAIGDTTERRLGLIAFGCFAYATVFVFEGVGLWFEKRWAEYLTIVVTASLLPFEVTELIHRQSTARVLALVVNLLVLVYLIWQLVAKRPGRRSAGATAGLAR